MKELSIEQKAKRYDEAIERAKKWHNAPNADKIPTLSTRVIEELFPELKESEGDKSKKWILEYLHDGLRKSDEQFKDHFKDAIAWLEKQGEQKPTDEEMKELLRTEYEKGRADAIAETQVDWSEEDEEYMRYLNTLVDNTASFEYSKKVKCFLKSLKPQPKQEWSEEDERMLDLIIAVFEVNHPNGYFKANELDDSNMRAVYTEEIVAWLKDLKQRITNKQ